MFLCVNEDGRNKEVRLKPPPCRPSAVIRKPESEEWLIRHTPCFGPIGGWDSSEGGWVATLNAVFPRIDRKSVGAQWLIRRTARSDPDGE